MMIDSYKQHFEKQLFFDDLPISMPSPIALTRRSQRTYNKQHLETKSPIQIFNKLLCKDNNSMPMYEVPTPQATTIVMVKNIRKERRHSQPQQKDLFVPFKNIQQVRKAVNSVREHCMAKTRPHQRPKSSPPVRIRSAVRHNQTLLTGETMVSPSQLKNSSFWGLVKHPFIKRGSNNLTTLLTVQPLTLQTDQRLNRNTPPRISRLRKPIRAYSFWDKRQATQEYGPWINEENTPLVTISVKAQSPVCRTRQ